MKFWRIAAVFFMGIAGGLALAFKLKKPETVINQSIKKMKARGTGNTQEVQMETTIPEKEKRGLFSANPEKKASRKARRAARKKK